MSLEDLREKIKDIPISSLISRYISIQKQGKDFLALCPFHQDTKPSLRINDSKNMFKCFACGAGGDIFTFVQKSRNYDFMEALKELAGMAGIPFDAYVQKKEQNPRDELALKITTTAAQVYRKYSQGDSRFDEFVKKRELKREIIEQFGVGFAPSSNSILTYLESIRESGKREDAIKMATELTLLKQDERSKNYYDFFRERIIFPIHNQFGHIVGFGGRAISDDQKAKYLNSQDSFLFKKQNILYGFYHAKRDIRSADKVILVEGYMDVIAFHQAGLPYTVGVMGIGLSDYAIAALKNLTSNIYLGLDSDAAGEKAMERSNELLLSNGIIAKVLNYAPSKDGDEFLRDHGLLAMQERLESAVPFIDRAADRLIEKGVPGSTNEKLAMLMEYFKVLAPLGLSLDATERATLFATRLELRSLPEQIIEKYKEFLRPDKKLKELEKKERLLPEKGDNQRQSNELSSKRNPISRPARLFLEEIIRYPHCLKDSSLVEVLDFVEDIEVKEFIAKLKLLILEVDASDYKKLVEELGFSINTPVAIQEIVGASLYNSNSNELNDVVTKRLLFDYKKMLMVSKLKTEKKKLRDLQATSLTATELNNLMQQMLEIDKKITETKSLKPPR